jgi:hypothetical protein
MLCILGPLLIVLLTIVYDVLIVLIHYHYIKFINTHVNTITYCIYLLKDNTIFYKLFQVLYELEEKAEAIEDERGTSFC